MIVKPADCVLAVGLATSRTGYLADLRRPDADFARRFRWWERYRHEIVRPLRRRCRQMTALGLTVAPDLTLPRFGALFNRRFKVVILFAHWKANAVELRDGFASAEAVVEQVPAGGEYVLDLCVCHPRELKIALRQHRPHCMVRSTHGKATPALWLAFYYFLMHRLYHEDLTYLQGLELAIDHFQRGWS